MAGKVAVSAPMHGLAYRAAAHLLHRLPLPTGTLAESVAGRKGARDRWVAWARRVMGASGAAPLPPLFWVHAASVGEALAAEPVVRRLAAMHAGSRFVLTHTSPSVVGWELPGVERVDYLPLDERGHIEPVLDVVRPTLVLFSRGDLWPVFTLGAAARRIPLAVTGGIVSTRSGRLRWPARSVLRPAAARLAYLGTASLEDAGRWRRLGARPEVLRVSGDPRHDAVLERPVDALAARTLRSWSGDHAVLVAGSVEPEDEAPLREALRSLPPAAFRAVVVPHDSSPASVERVCRGLSRAGITFATWEDVHAIPHERPVLVLNRRGVLFDLYAAADIAFVGGGFGHAVHSVLEPAAFATPVVTGPRGMRDPDVAALVAAGGARCTADAPALAEALSTWLLDPAARSRAGLSARRAMQPGAAAVDAVEVSQLIGR